jgi:hypothetical protein
LRIQLNWDGTQRHAGVCTAAGGACDWSATDNTIGGMATDHIRGIATLYATPTFITHRSGKFGARYDPILTAAGRTGWNNFITAAAQRYGPNGLFWKQHPSLPYTPLRTWQVWNEMNTTNAFRPGPSPKLYGALLKFTASHIRAVDPGASIILGGMFGTPGGTQAMSETAWDFLDGLYKVKGARKAFSAVALHPYSPNIKGIRYQIVKLRQALKRNHDAKTKMWLTELGWGSDAAHTHTANGLVKTPQQQKKLLVGSFKLLRSNRNTWNIAGLTWFSLRDPTVGQCTFCLSSGLLHTNYSPKPAWFAYVHFTGGTP